MPTDPTAAADAAIDKILGAGGMPKPGVDGPPSQPSVVDTGATKSTKEAEVPEPKGGKNRRNSKAGKDAPGEDFFDVEEIPLEDRKQLYMAIKYADGRVEWRLDIGDAAVDKAFGMQAAYVTFKSKGGAEQELIDKLLTAWAAKLASPDIGAYLNLTNRYNLFTQLRQYAGTKFEPPAPKEDGSYDTEEFKTYVEVSTRKLGSVPYAMALQRLGLYEKRLVSCLHAIHTGTFLKAGR